MLLKYVEAVSPSLSGDNTASATFACQVIAIKIGPMLIFRFNYFVQLIFFIILFRNPWVEKPESSTNSSCGSRSGRTRHTTSQPTSEWLLPRNQTLSHQGPLLNQQIQPVIVSARGPGSAVSTTRESSGGVSAAGGIGSCGGQCIACETFCYYFLQV